MAAEGPNIWAMVTAALVAGVPATLAARYALKQKKIEVTHEDARTAADIGAKTMTELFAAQSKFADDLRADRADLTRHVIDLQESRQKLWDEIDRLHHLRQEENQRSRDALEACERRCVEATRKVESLSARIAMLELIVPHSNSEGRDG
jgi:uncharacterized membrane-anchored protein YhcB (DUF1043 family)